MLAFSLKTLYNALSLTGSIHVRSGFLCNPDTLVPFEPYCIPFHVVSYVLQPLKSSLEQFQRLLLVFGPYGVSFHAGLGKYYIVLIL